MSEAALRYVVLRHEGVETPHYDLMFETTPGSPLATWRSAAWPLSHELPLEPLADHRRAYLEYEGPVSNDRGYVRRIATGTHKVLQNDPSMLIVKLDAGHELRLAKAPKRSSASK